VLLTEEKGFKKKKGREGRAGSALRCSSFRRSGLGGGRGGGGKEKGGGGGGERGLFRLRVGHCRHAGRTQEEKKIRKKGKKGKTSITMRAAGRHERSWRDRGIWKKKGKKKGRGGKLLQSSGLLLRRHVHRKKVKKRKEKKGGRGSLPPPPPLC